MTAEKIYIRAAGFADIPILSDLIRVSFRDVAERFALTLENCPKHPSNCTDEWVKNDFVRGAAYYILEHDGAPVGCVALEKANPELCYLERLGVLPRSRRKGFGKALVDHVFYEASSLGAKQISVGIISDDTELQLWYQRIGFVEKETKEFTHLPFLVTFMSYEL
jgi:ribosomal protein S18 acetylase RimI-like enzyme